MRQRRGRARPGHDHPSTPPPKIKQSASDKRDGASSRSAVLALLLIFYPVMAGLACWWIYWLPKPLDASAPKVAFSEARAVTHIDVLAKRIGFRQVSTPGNKAAADYLIQQCEHLALIARSRGLHAEVDVEMVSGGLNDVIFHRKMTNVFRNLTNIFLYIAPKEMAGAKGKALLVNSHYDSAYGSPGAADCAACVAVELEVTRAILEGNKEIKVPLLMMFNGAEETISQAVNGFMRSSKWLEKVGAFINIESTGSEGVPMLFQYCGLWTLEAYAKSAKYPRGMVTAQDFFDSKAIPADTDFRAFAANRNGTLPGIDIATVLGAAAYHTDRDTLERTPLGVVQEYGDTMASLVEEFSSVMAEGVPDMTNEGRAVFFDVFHSYMVCYGMDTAQWLHMVPAGMIVLAYLAVRFKSGANRVEKEDASWLAFTGVVRAVTSLVLSLVLPAVSGAGIVYVTGAPMVWFSNHFALYLIFVPIALIGLLQPWKPNVDGAHISGNMVGICITLMGLVVPMTRAKIGSSVVFAVVVFSTALAALLMPKNPGSVLKAFPVLLCGVWPTSAHLTLGIVFLEHLAEKITLAGSGDPEFGQLVPDAVVGGLLGVLLWIVMIPLAPYFVGLMKRRQKRMFLGALLCVSLGSAAYFKSNHPFSDLRPKRVLLSHTHRLMNDSSIDSFWSVATWDPIPIESVFPPEVANLKPKRSTPREWLAFYPFHDHGTTMRFPAPALKAKGVWGENFPVLRKDRHEDVTVGGVNVRRLYLEVVWDKPAWGTMNVTGPVTGWSWTDSLDGEPRYEGGPIDYLIRFTQDDVDRVWPFWVDIEEGGELRIEMSVIYMTATEEINEMAAKFPEWTTVGKGTVFLSDWQFS